LPLYQEVRFRKEGT